MVQMWPDPSGSAGHRSPVWFPGPGYGGAVGMPTGASRVIAGRYRLVKHLGSGGMGHVWLAHDELLRRQVAVKEVFPPAGVSDDERDMLHERTLREARTAARLNHPNVVAVYDVVEDDGRPWIIMELVRARSLREMVDGSGPLDPRAAARIGLQLLGALQSAHQIGVMHRDVKPGNVLIGTEGRVVLADFGIARAEGGPATTTSGIVVGSPPYIAPERARGERGGPASDLWSLGATLYAAVEGRPPYDRAGVLPTLMAVVSEDPDPPRRAGALWPVISGLLAADPSRRLSSDAAERMLRQVAARNAPGHRPARHRSARHRSDARRRAAHRPGPHRGRRATHGHPGGRRENPGPAPRRRPGPGTHVRGAGTSRASSTATAPCRRVSAGRGRGGGARPARPGLPSERQPGAPPRGAPSWSRWRPRCSRWR